MVPLEVSGAGRGAAILILDVRGSEAVFLKALVGGNSYIKHTEKLFRPWKSLKYGFPFDM